MHNLKTNKKSTSWLKWTKMLFAVLAVVMWISMVAMSFTYMSTVSLPWMKIRPNTSYPTNETKKENISASEDKNIKGNHSVIMNGTDNASVCSGCFKLDFKVMINEPKLCDGKVTLLMLITSTISNSYGRSSIRDTWGGVCNKPTSKIKCLFLFGNRNNSAENQALLKEHQTYHDIYQCDFYDAYANLTYKTMMGLKWAIQHCPQAGYIMKTDDDMYVNTELLPFMLERAPDKKFMGGFCWGPSLPNRDPKTKWYVSFEQYKDRHLPKMCSGTGYVMSHDVAISVVKISTDIAFFFLEDVYVALCVKKLGYQPMKITGFNNMFQQFDPCKYRNQILTSHSVNAGSRISYWKKIKECPKKNSTPSMVFHFSYV